MKHMQRFGCQQTRADPYGILCEGKQGGVVRVYRGFIPPNGGKKRQLFFHSIVAKSCGHSKLNQYGIHQVVTVVSSKLLNGIEVVVLTETKERMGNQTIMRIQRAIEEEGKEKRRLVCRHTVDGYDNASEGVEEKACVWRVVRRSVKEFKQ